MPGDPPIYYPRKGSYSQDTSRSQSAPNPHSFDDVGHYLSDQQEPINTYSVALLALHPPGGQYAVTTASTNSFGKPSTAVHSRNSYIGSQISDPSYDQVSLFRLQLYLCLIDIQHFSIVTLGIDLIPVKVGTTVQQIADCHVDSDLQVQRVTFYINRSRHTRITKSRL